MSDGVRLDKWLWAARFFKTRSLAAEEIGKHRVEVNGQVAKASRELRPGDEIALRQGPVARAADRTQRSHHHGPRHRPLAQRDLVAGPELARGLGDLAVDLDAVLADLLGRQTARLELSLIHI